MIGIFFGSPVAPNLSLHSRKLSCPLETDYFNRKCIFQPLIFMGHVSFPGRCWMFRETSDITKTSGFLLQVLICWVSSRQICSLPKKENLKCVLLHVARNNIHKRNLFKPNSNMFPWKSSRLNKVLGWSLGLTSPINAMQSSRHLKPPFWHECRVEGTCLLQHVRGGGHTPHRTVVLIQNL